MVTTIYSDTGWLFTTYKAMQISISWETSSVVFIVYSYVNNYRNIENRNVKRQYIFQGRG